MADTEQGVPLTGLAFDTDLYGNGAETPYMPSIGVGDDEEQDEREQALSRSVCSSCKACCVMQPSFVARNARSTDLVPHAHRRRMQYTAPKSVLNSIPTDANDSVRSPPPPPFLSRPLPLPSGVF